MVTQAFVGTSKMGMSFAKRVAVVFDHIDDDFDDSGDDKTCRAEVLIKQNIPHTIILCNLS